MISVAHAAEQAGEVVARGPGAPEFILLLLFVLIFYFLLWRPQSKRAKEHRELVGSVQKGDEIAVAGGMVGKVVKVADDFLTLNISDNVNVIVQRQAVTQVLPKGTIKDL